MAIRLRAVLVTAVAVSWLVVPATRAAHAASDVAEPAVTTSTAVRGGPEPSALVGSLWGSAAQTGPSVAVGAASAVAGSDATPAPRWASAATAAIHPGVLTETSGGGICTSDFVFTAGPDVYLGQAAHCAGTGPETETDGCTSATLPLGTPVTIDAADGSRRVGTLAYSSWVTMRARHERNRAACAYNDFALVRITPSDVGAVNPSVPFFGGPTGLDTGGLAPGAPAYTYGNAPGHLGTPAPKVGVAAADVGGGFGHVVYTLAPGIPGDSGGAYLGEGGTALGLLATLDPGAGSNGVADLAKAVDYAGAHGGLGAVTLALGTQPFTPAPPGVDTRALATPAGPPLGG